MKIPSAAGLKIDMAIYIIDSAVCISPQAAGFSKCFYESMMKTTLHPRYL